MADRRGQINGDSGSEAIGWALDQQQYNRLVGYCWRLTRDRDAAEDMAGETLFEACRNMHKLIDIDGLERWLWAIARHVCLRWRRQRARDARLRSLADWQAVPDDMAVAHTECRYELDADLSDALASLPAKTRDAFLLRHLDDASYAEIAARLDLSEDAISMRLSRARSQLRSMLERDRPEETSAPMDRRAWQETRLWCARCGDRQLQMRFGGPGEIVAFRCPACDDDPRLTATEMPLANAHFARLLAGVRQPAAINRRIEGWVNDYFRRALANSTIECTNCARQATVIHSMPGVQPTPSPDRLGMHVRCDHCGTACSSSLHSLVMTLPEVSAFRSEHGRFRTLPEAELEVAGRPAIRTTIESVSSSARLDVLSALDTFAVLGIHRAHQFNAT